MADPQPRVDSLRGNNGSEIYHNATGSGIKIAGPNERSGLDLHPWSSNNNDHIYKPLSNMRTFCTVVFVIFHQRPLELRTRLISG